MNGHNISLFPFRRRKISKFLVSNRVITLQQFFGKSSYRCSLSLLPVLGVNTSRPAENVNWETVRGLFQLKSTVSVEYDFKKDRGTQLEKACPMVGLR